MTLIDTPILNFLMGLTGKYLLVDWLFIFLAEALIYIIIIVSLIYLARIKEWKKRAEIFLLGALAVILSRGIITPILEHLINSPRPFVVTGIEPLIQHAATSSFPSGHIAFILPIAITLWYINRKAGWWAYAGVFLIGVSRVAIGVHWPTDILGGILVGIISFFVAQRLLKGVLEKPEKVHQKTKSKLAKA